MQTCSNRMYGVLPRLILASGFAIAVFAPAPVRSQAAVACVNCSQMTTQLMEYGKEAQSLVTQIQQYQTQLQSYLNMVTNTVALPQQVWSTVQGDIMRLQELSNAASLLSGNSGSLISRLQGASAFVSGVGGAVTDPMQQFSMYSQTIGNNLNAMGHTLGIQQGQEANNAALLAALQAHSQSAAGQMQAIQAGNELAHQQATQLLQIQTTLSTTAQMEATQMAVNADRQANYDAEMTRFNSPAPVATTGYKEW